MWKKRRWRKLLNLIDHLPRHSHYAQAVAEDPEHMAAIEKAMAASGGGPTGPAPVPSLVGWTPEVDKLTDIVDAVKGLQETLMRVNMDKKANQKFKGLERELRPGRPRIAGKAKQGPAPDQMVLHKKLVAKLLPPKAD